MEIIKNLSRQDRNGVRTPTDLERRYKFNQIELTKEEIDELKLQVITDDHLSIESKNPIQNKVVTQALNDKINRGELNGKVDKEEGKGLSSNDFTNEEKSSIAANTNARHSHSNKSLLDSYTQTEANLKNAVDNTHTHSNKTVLDTFTKTEEEILNTIAGSSHSHSNKTVLDGITSDKVNRWNNIPLYENGGTTDANTTTEELILTKVNTPTTDFWYVETLFYGSKSTSSNRKQIAYSYKFDAPIYTRYCISGVWSEWTTGEIKSSSIADYEGHLWFKNGMLLQWGQVTIKPTAANTVTSANVTFTHTYDFAPFVTATPQIAYPDAVTTSIGSGTTDSGAKGGMSIYMTRTNTSETTFRWVAIGFKQA